MSFLPLFFILLFPFVSLVEEAGSQAYRVTSFSPNFAEATDKAEEERSAFV